MAKTVSKVKESTPVSKAAEELKESPPSNLAVVADDYSQYDGFGFENQTSDDYSIPFLGILQAMSPQLQESSALRQGMIVNTVTGEIYGDDGVAFVPAYTQHVYVEWKPRAAGGGLVAIHEVSSDFVAQVKRATGQAFGKLSTPDGNELIETFYVYGVSVDSEGTPSEAVLSFSSTKIKPYKAWMTKAKTIQLIRRDGMRMVAPLMAHRYRLKTVSEKNNKGNYFNWAINFDAENAQGCRLGTQDPVFQMAVKVKQMIETGKARAATESLSPGDDRDFSEEGSSPGNPGGKPVF